MKKNKNVLIFALVLAVSIPLNVFAGTTLGTNLIVGDGTPDVTQDGEDAYIEGTLEVDGSVTLGDGFVFTAAADIVNYWNFNGAEDEESLIVAATGTSDDIGIIIRTKGSDSDFKLEIADDQSYLDVSPGELKVTNFDESGEQEFQYSAGDSEINLKHEAADTSGFSFIREIVTETPDDDDVLFTEVYKGKDDGDNDAVYAQGVYTITDVTDATEDALVELKVVTGGTEDTTYFSYGNAGISFFGETPVPQQDSSLSDASFVQNAGTAFNSASTFDGYTVGDIVDALQAYGLLQ